MKIHDDLTLYSVCFTVVKKSGAAGAYTSNEMVDVLTLGVPTAIETILSHYPDAVIVSVNKSSKGRKVILGNDIDLWGLKPQEKI